MFVYNYIDDHNKRYRCARSTKARIVDTEKKIRGGLYRRWTKVPVVEFEVNGQTYRAVGNAGNDQYTVGDEVEIFFNPEKPSEIAQSFPLDNYNFFVAGCIICGCSILCAMIGVIATIL